MSIKWQLLVGAATLTILGGVSASANAATPECGMQCGSVFSRELGSWFLLAVTLASIATEAPVSVADA